MRRKNHVGFVDFTEGEDEEKVQHCQHCSSFGVTTTLGPRQVQKGQEPGPDWDNLRQCPLCGTIYDLYEVSNTPQIKDSTKTIDNPYEQGKFVAESIPKRNSDQGSKSAARRHRKRELDDIKDADIRREVAQYGEDAVKIVYDSDP